MSKEKTRKEDFLHYLWKYSLFEKGNLETTDGQKVEVIVHGEYNTDSGPDFTNARIKLNDTLWAGNIEIHQRSSDWIRHGHQTDKAYDSVILHVVENDDAPIVRTCGTPVPALALRFNNLLLDNYEHLLRSKRWIYCEDTFDTVPSIVVNMWIERLVVERLESKTHLIVKLLEESKNDWHTAFYQLLARSFGTNVNADAFEMLAKSLPHSVLAKHKNDVTQIEALLFGQSGLLEMAEDDEYVKGLKNEYAFLKGKYKLEPIPSSSWKFMRLRPMNFPTVRIAQFARLIHVSTGLLSKVIEAGTADEVKQLFNIDVSEYWLTHYSFGKTSTHKQKHLGHSAVETILINTVVPFMFYYGKMNGQEDLQEKALQVLGSIPFEQNQITGRWVGRVPDCENASRSQALIHLEKNYCAHGKCLQCAIGNSIVRSVL